jgi:hypothetical protein
MSRDLTAEELAALQRFALAQGRTWKRVLTDIYWYNARLWVGPSSKPNDGSILHGLRNDLGPAWLATFKLPRA